MKKILIVVAALLMLSCSCRNEVTESSRAAASVTGCLSGHDTIGVVLHVSRVIDGEHSGELLNEGVAAGHAAGSRREQEVQLLVGELANDVQDFPEEAALRLLCGGVGITDTLRDATHVGDAVPAGTDDGTDFSFESTEDSLLDFTHDS